jgi:hypothetical protein
MKKKLTLKKTVLQTLTKEDLKRVVGGGMSRAFCAN